MKLSEFKTDYYEFSGLASSSSRQLAMAGIALLWLFKSGGGTNTYTLPIELFLPAALLVASLGSDLIQYILGTVIWGAFHRHHENRRKSEDDDPSIEAPPCYSYPITVFFYLKIIFVLVAYFLVLTFALSEVTFE